MATIRRATIEDLDRVHHLALEFYAEDGFTTSAAQLRDNLRPLITSAPVRCAVAVLDGTPIGFAITTTTFGLENGLIAELEDLYVLPARRRLGIANTLIDDSAEWARARGCVHLELVIAPNGLDVTPLITYYSARGFADAGRRLLARAL